MNNIKMIFSKRLIMMTFEKKNFLFFKKYLLKLQLLKIILYIYLF
jgi:hypothetical protein